MKTIEKVKMIKTVVAGSECWEAGTILPVEGEALPSVILQEIQQKTGTVEVLSMKPDPVMEESKLVVPLNDNVLLEAGREEKGMAEKLVAVKVEAEKAIYEKFQRQVAETKESFESLKSAFVALEETFVSFKETVLQELKEQGIKASEAGKALKKELEAKYADLEIKIQDKKTPTKQTSRGGTGKTRLVVRKGRKG